MTHPRGTYYCGASVDPASGESGSGADVAFAEAFLLHRDSITREAYRKKGILHPSDASPPPSSIGVPPHLMDLPERPIMRA